MIPSTAKHCWLLCLLYAFGVTDLHAQKSPYDVFPPAEPPYYRVRYDASTKQGKLTFPVNYTIWFPKDVKTLRGVLVHQHGCGEGSCKSGLTGAYDLHWQALAKKHDCALLSPSYEQPDKADCQLWCDPRNGSDAAFQQCLVDLGKKSGHPELAEVPWALWGHSGGGHWAGGMVLLHPERVAAAWLRSGVPFLKADPKRAGIKAYTLQEAALKVPVMCNLGTKEGVTTKDGSFAGVWPANEAFFNEVRSKGGLIGVAVDPLTSHECGNQRYLAIPWLDACLSARLPKAAGDPMRPMPTDKAWLAPIIGGEALPAEKYKDEATKAAWLPNEALAKAWMEYVKDTKVTDTTPPPVPTNVRLQGNTLTWEAEADLESGLASFIIERDGRFLANVPEQGKNPFGRPIFQNLQYSDTPPQPLLAMQFTDTKAEPGKKYTYRVIAVNTVGLKSKSSAEPAKADKPPEPKDGPLGMKFVPLPKATFYLGWKGEKGSAKKTEIKEDFENVIYTVTQGQSQELIHAAEPQKPVKVFILAGQSNMEGKAPNTLLDHQATDPKTKDLFAHLRKDDKWIVRDDVFIKFLDRKGPLTVGYGSPGRTGVELEFGTVMGDYFEEPVLLIKTAWGGHSLYKLFRSPFGRVSRRGGAREGTQTGPGSRQAEQREEQEERPAADDGGDQEGVRVVVSQDDGGSERRDG